MAGWMIESKPLMLNKVFSKPKKAIYTARKPQI
jgi:hypothetical protein